MHIGEVGIYLDSLLKCLKKYYCDATISTQFLNAYGVFFGIVGTWTKKGKFS